MLVISNYVQFWWLLLFCSRFTASHSCHISTNLMNTTLIYSRAHR
jgi:hypothetical protein